MIFSQANAEYWIADVGFVIVSFHLRLKKDFSYMTSSETSPIHTSSWPLAPKNERHGSQTLKVLAFKEPREEK